MDNQPGPSPISRFKFPTKLNSQSSMIIGLVVILIVAGLGFWFWPKRKTEVSLPKSAEQRAEQQEQQAEELQENVGGGLGASIYEKSQNPIADKLSETNPFGKTPINPLKSIYNNPFE